MLPPREDLPSTSLQGRMQLPPSTEVGSYALRMPGRNPFLFILPDRYNLVVLKPEHDSWRVVVGQKIKVGEKAPMAIGKTLAFYAKKSLISIPPRRYAYVGAKPEHEPGRQRAEHVALSGHLHRVNRDFGVETVRDLQREPRWPAVSAQRASTHRMEIWIFIPVLPRSLARVCPTQPLRWQRGLGGV